MSGLTAFDRRLDPACSAPIAVAVSGGADSLLALRLTTDWAMAHGRRVIALSVDHHLQPMSAAWSAFAARSAEALGAEARVLEWTGDKPITGVPAAARAARHRLLADAAREAGARVLVTGHTASDAAENAALGQGGLGEWTPSPAWPQGRGLFLLRPLLGISREAVRGRLAAEGALWVDDPANSDERHARVRARKGLGADAIGVARQARDLPAGLAQTGGHHLALDKAALAQVDVETRRQVLATAAVCAGGGSRLPRARASERLVRAEPLAATLTGARIAPGDRRIIVTRNVGDIGRANAAPLRLAAGESAIWDGRYEVTAARPCEVRPLFGLAARLHPAERRALAALPALVRGALPVLVCQDGPPTCPILAQDNANRAHWLVPARFSAACGQIAHEGQL